MADPHGTPGPGGTAGAAGAQGLEPDAEQQRAIESFGRLTVVPAGAGSGKTQTMVWRLVNAFDPAIVGHRDLVLDSIDQALVITFTRVAAQKLKRDLRSAFEEPAFRARHPREAAAIDGAWIGTIHAMARRLLQEQAAALGLDPSLRVLGEWRARELLAQAIEVTLSQETITRADGAVVPNPAPELLATLPVGRVQSMLADLVTTARTQVGGLGALRTAAHPSGGDEARWRALIDLARAAGKTYGRAKRRRGVLDDDDLLLETHRALSDPSLGVAERYAQRFRHVVVDEVQDIDGLQYRIIRRLAGPNLERLCVVGDPNQSIYGFRHADPTLLESLLEGAGPAQAPAPAPEGAGPDAPSSAPAAIIPLVANYRSSSAITSFVNDVFGEGRDGEPPLFCTYRPLEARPARTAPPNGRPGDRPSGAAVEVVARDPRRRDGGPSRPSALEARLIASWFRALGEQGAIPYGEMALLLGRMGEAETYGRALDEAGIPHGFVGGSVLSQRPVPRMLLSTAEALANPRDDGAMTRLLASDLFGFTPNDFHRLTRGVGCRLGPSECRQPGWVLSRCLAGELPLPADFPKLALACDTLDRALGILHDRPLEAVLRQVLGESGWFERTLAGADAGPVAARAALADARKVLRIIARLEGEGAHGPRELAEDLATYLRRQNDTPGFIESADRDFVAISTVHSAKGEQFRAVAVAQVFGVGLRDSRPRTLEMATLGDRAYASLKTDGPSPAGSVDGGIPPADAVTISGATSARAVIDTLEEVRRHGSAEQWHELVGPRRRAARAEEAARLAYVALTRARERLLVCLPPEDGGATGEVDPVARRIRQVAARDAGANADVRLVPEGKVPWDASLPHGGSTEPNPPDDGADRPFSIPTAVFAPPTVDREFSQRWARGILSHTALEQRRHGEGPHPTGDPDPLAVERGSLFHELCEYAVNHRERGRFAEPPDPVIRAIARRRRDPRRAARIVEGLEEPLGRWLGSPIARRLAALEHVRAEVPFYVPLALDGRPAPLVLNGSIDLIAHDDPEGPAWICDFKTGYTALGPNEWRSAFEEQALIYAHAALSCGFSRVRLAFILVDRPAPPGEVAHCTFPERGFWTADFVTPALRAILAAALDPADAGSDRRNPGSPPGIPSPGESVDPPPGHRS